jgi:SMI1 / KNR4 family (SUKH-1)
MKFPQLIDDLYLADLSHRIRTLPPDEAASALFECGAIVLLAGHPEIAYQLFTSLLNGELKTNENSSVASWLRSILPSLCYSLEINCPPIFSRQEWSSDDLEWYIQEMLERYKGFANLDKWVFEIPFPSSDWSEDFIQEMTHPKADSIVTNERLKVYKFIQDLHRFIAAKLTTGSLLEAKQLLLIFEDVIKAWHIECDSYIEHEIIIFGIRIYLGLNDSINADRYIIRWWRTSTFGLMNPLWLLLYQPDVMRRISQGVLQDEIRIPLTQAQELLRSIDKRNYDPQQIGFIPTIEDWTVFLDKWNQKTFERLTRENFPKHNHYSEDRDYDCYHLPGATEAQIVELEQKLQTKLPVGYRNFLLASNGFVSLDRRYMFWDTDKIDWFIQENRDWAEIWGNSGHDISDEKYLQYGDDRDCCWIRGQYMKTALQISIVYESDVYLLNPLIIDNRNEWEAWDFGTKYPGAVRYRSFWDMMQKLYKKAMKDSRSVG